MKNLCYLLILISGICNAQIVNIPDANFKAKLLSASSENNVAYGNGGYVKIDSNDDGEIQDFEALQIDSLNIYGSNIIDLNGIANFNNLKKLNCNSNQIQSLDVSNILGLQQLFCDNNALTTLNTNGLVNLIYLRNDNNQLTGLNLTGLNNLETLICFNNPLGTLNASELSNIKYINCSGDSLTSLNVSGLNNLLELDCGYNQLTTLDLNSLNSLKKVDCVYNSLTSINLTGLINLTEFNSNGNLLTSIDFSGLTNLRTIVCANSNLTTINLSGLDNIFDITVTGNQLQAIDFSGLTSLNYIFCGYNNLTSINISNLPNLKYIACTNNQISALDFSNHPILESLVCNDNLFTTLDFSNNPLFNFLQCDNNNLTFINIKNGTIENDTQFDSWTNNPNLTYVCADENEINNIQSLLIQTGSSSVVMNTYCSFIPGGNYNTISGNVKFDADNNGCDVNDSVQPNIRMKITDSNAIIGAGFTNNFGNYSFYTQEGTFTITPDVENPSWFNFLPNTANIVFADNNNNVATQDFCVAANGFHPDIEVVISPISPARPGFDAVYQIAYKNKGNYTYTDGFVNLEYDDSVLDFVSTSQSPNSEGLGSIGWIFSNLLPFESRSIQVTFNVNAPTEIPALNIGDVLTFRVYSYPSEVDETPLDNEFIYNQTVVGSYDPNDITCLEGNSLPPSEIGNYLHYAINFENTGNYPAENIVVKTEVDATKFDINSLQLLATSNPVDARITGNKVEFIFQNIQLPIGGHGHILLKVKSKSSLVIGDSVAKRADIFFDYNAPIDTGFANTTFQTLSNTIFETDTTINVYPNPTTSKITINSDFDLKSIQVYDVQGRILETLIGVNKILDISNKSNGVYFLKITTSKGSKIEKLIKK